MLKQRILTAIVLIPIVIGLVLATQLQVFSGIITGLTIAMFMEWVYLIGYKKIGQWALAAMGSFLIAAIFFRQNAITPLLYFGLIIWCAALYFLFTYPRHVQFWQNTIWKILIGMLLLMPMWAGLLTLRALSHGEQWIMYLLLLMWIADSAAYFIGRAYGKHKLAPAVSPGKSWEGLGGAVLAVCCWSFFIGWLVLHFTGIRLAIFVSISLVTALISVVGDLTESMIKRQQGVKDSSHLLPGHGGLLDRLDSLIAAAPIFALGMITLLKEVNG